MRAYQCDCCKKLFVIGEDDASPANLYVYNQNRDATRYDLCSDCLERVKNVLNMKNAMEELLDGRD